LKRQQLKVLRKSYHQTELAAALRDALGISTFRDRGRRALPSG
jgi:hypothetical protein